MGSVNKRDERIGQKRITSNGTSMTCVEYADCQNITIAIEYKNGEKTTAQTTWDGFDKCCEPLKARKNERKGEEKHNKQNCLMKIIEYNDANNIVVEFQDKYKARVHTKYSHFIDGGVKNPYFPVFYNVGMVGNKYPAKVNGKTTKEYQTWSNVLKRCFDNKIKQKLPTYKDVVCCEEWLLYENFYEWLHSQENFDKWLNGEKWAIDKDILVKGNKIYSPETCCLVPHNINSLFVRQNKTKDNLPTCVRKNGNKFVVYCVINNKNTYIGTYNTIEEAFDAYKNIKENIIKQNAQIEYAYNNITKQCYDAMMNYKVEIAD